MRNDSWLENGDNEVVEFDIHCKMKKCWADEFLSFLQMIQRQGRSGHSSMVGFYADGDGDFRPTFETSFQFETKKELPGKGNTIECYFDAG